MSETWVCPHGAAFSGSSDFISGARSAHEDHGEPETMLRAYVRWLLDYDPEAAARLIAINPDSFPKASNQDTGRA